MGEDSDWRLAGQQAYLWGLTLVHRTYRRSTSNSGWDHDHCEFCRAKFAVGGAAGALDRGYASPDDYRWICERCFADLKDRFRWTVVESPA